ncbi:ABC transporter substrate-binding protein [Aurantimonas aggregata]|uniref:ABC transporter substrate-binding protein n=2 Tax=Aurantimonas aggregata TaxID=2047720 RepID=A0A6L9MN03_9HYPH|nr:ABC transporter substrate-binding protein [Aurantimonas aggregata]NDV89203.1 ABC transporter substrate-binding protein [Aurantimonas aggregata]
MALTGLVTSGASAVAQDEPGGIITVATIGEPNTLDPMAATGDLLGMVTQHFLETLYTFDKEWNVTPLLAADLPEISDDGKTVTIALREGIKFHNGKTMTADDVVASLERWFKIASRGQLVADKVEKIEATDASTVTISLSAPFGPLPALLAFNNSAAVILPKETLAEPLTEFVGTGPFMLKERRPDQYIQLVRFADYQPLEGEPDGFGGRREALLEEVRFVPVPDANTRVEGAVAGQYDYAELLPVESFDRLTGQTEPMLTESFGWPMFIMNTKQGVMTDQNLRKAVQALQNSDDLMLAAFGEERFFKVDGALYPEGYVWRNETGVEAYNQGDVEKAKSLAEQAGYDGEPIRILTSRQYEFHYKMAQVLDAYLKSAGLNSQLDVVDWATLVQRRADPALWDIFITHSPFLPDPALIAPLPASYPGWWSTPEKEELLTALNTETDLAKRQAIWADIQGLIYEQAPFYKVGDFAALAAKSPKVEGFEASPWPYFWNVSLAK